MDNKDMVSKPKGLNISYPQYQH